MKAAAEEEDDDDAAFFGLDDDDFEEDEPEEKPKPRRTDGAQHRRMHLSAQNGRKPKIEQFDSRYVK